MALLGTVMIAIMSLFFLGRRNVYSGRQMTKAIAIGNRVLEDLSLLTKQDVYYGVFSINDTDAGSDLTVMGKTYTNARIRTSNPSLVTPADATEYATEKADGPHYLSLNWTPMLTNQLTDSGHGTQAAHGQAGQGGHRAGRRVEDQLGPLRPA